MVREINLKRIGSLLFKLLIGSIIILYAALNIYNLNLLINRTETLINYKKTSLRSICKLNDRIRNNNNLIKLLDTKNFTYIENIYNKIKEINNNLTLKSDKNLELINKTLKIDKQITNHIDNIYAKIKRPNFNNLKLAVVEIATGNSGGAGVVYKIDEDYLYILTAKHMTLTPGKINILVTTLDNKKIIIFDIPRKNIIEDKFLDLAIIKAPKPKGNFHFLSLAKENPSIGTKIYMIGHPAGVYYNINDGLVSNYIIKSFLNTKRYYMLISALVFHGNSGGPVVNAKNEIVGIAVGYIYIPASRHCKDIRRLYHLTIVTKLSDIQNLINSLENND